MVIDVLFLQESHRRCFLMSSGSTGHVDLCPIVVLVFVGWPQRSGTRFKDEEGPVFLTCVWFCVTCFSEGPVEGLAAESRKGKSVVSPLIWCLK